MKVIFIGVHNKPGLEPLCSSTKSGKLIDRVIAQLICNTLKTNLYDVNYLPVGKDVKETYASDWLYRIVPNRNDIVILLGAEVQKYYRHYRGKILIFAHPASIWSNAAKERYVKKMVKEIKPTHQ